MFEWRRTILLAPPAVARMLEFLMGANYPTKIVLASLSGNVCAFPKCDTQLTYPASVGSTTHVGEAAHICGEKPGAPRFDPLMTDAERNRVENLIYLCAHHHTIIDKADSTWTIATLQEMKAQHESRVRDAMEKSFQDVSFPELQSAVSWVTNQVPMPDGSFHLITPDEKIRKNALSSGSRHIIAAGLMAQATVAAYVEAEAQLDSDFPGRLKAGFLAEYYSRQMEGHKGDELFEIMCAFAQKGLQSQAERTAGVAVLIYLFEICDVFEK